MSTASILIVEDEPGIRELISLFFKQRGYQTLLAEDGPQALSMIDQEMPQLILLDVEMPGMNGFEVCEQIRKVTTIPILFVSCKRESFDIIKGLSVGADDYITKPFDFYELEARVLAMLRRSHWLKENESDDSEIISYGDLRIDLQQCELYVKGEPVPLPNKEYQLLVLMAKHPNRVWTAEQLYDHIWGIYSEGSPQTVKVHISNLRRKLEGDPSNPEYIQTVRGFGYKFST